MLIAPLIRTIEVPDETGALVQIEYAGEALTLSLAQMTSFPTRRLRSIGSVANHKGDIRRGLDRLFTGF